MALKSFDQHLESLRDGREVYFDGQRVEDVTTHPILSVAMAHAAIDYQLAQEPEHRDLATYVDPETNEIYSRYFKLPQATDDLLKRRELIAAGTRAGKGVVPLIKEIGTDALFALHIVADHMDKHIGTAYLAKVRQYYATCRAQDLGFAVAQTDVKGDRSKRPSEQAHPDYYVRVVERRDDGIVVRGAKAHTTATPFANELIILPTRAVTEADADYAVSFAIPVNTPGLKLIAEVSSHALNNHFDYPVSSDHKMVDTLTIFDDVFVPWERVFLCGEWRYAGALANTFVEFHRFTAASYKLPMCELFIGAAALIAEYNGTTKATHIGDKIMELIAWTETTRGLLLAAALEHKVVPPGIAVPNITLTNIAKHHFARNYHLMVQNLQDIAGGLLATAPLSSNWGNEATRPYLDHYLGGIAGVSGEKRVRAMNLIRDIAASEFGGYQEILSIHAEGSLAAQRITILRDYDVERCLALAKKAAHLED
ncbi:MAG TPA: 4-hydroxyphenylacetate 3-hydroxylase N-terminal domain-containing protein [Anaerolineae bacterium]|nr:4-hydroxyphenylacetate 3-hydroxylase N-terminal domain-containing protein [Anaerolineae bacterium]